MSGIEYDGLSHGTWAREGDEEDALLEDWAVEEEAGIVFRGKQG
jgi:hypothetical protein